MAAYNVQVNDPDGRTICMALVEATRVSDITTERFGPTVYIKLNGDTVAVGTTMTGEDVELSLLRWPLGKAGVEPVEKAVPVAPVES